MPILIVSFKELKEKAKKMERSNRVWNLCPILKCPVITVIQPQKLPGCASVESQDWASPRWLESLASGAGPVAIILSRVRISLRTCIMSRVASKPKCKLLTPTRLALVTYSFSVFSSSSSSPSSFTLVGRADQRSCVSESSPHSGLGYKRSIIGRDTSWLLNPLVCSSGQTV